MITARKQKIALIFISVWLTMIGSQGGLDRLSAKPSNDSAPTVVSGAGDITAVVEQYRTLLGTNNGGEPGSRGTGRREINWDKVPDNLAAPNFLPPDFF